MRYQERMLLVLFIILMMSFPVSGLCQGKLTLEPKISTTWRTDDNFYKAETSERKVATSIIQPGFEFDFDTGKTQISLDYSLNAYYYNDKDALVPGMQPAQDEEYVGHTGILEVKTRPTDRITVGISDSYFYTRDPANSDVFSNSITRKKYYINRVTPSLFYRFGEKFNAGLRYRNTKTDYSSESEVYTDTISEDSTENRAIFDLVYNINRKTTLDFEYQYWNRAYEYTSDYKSNQMRLIFIKQYKYFSFEAGGGYHERNFDDPSLENIDLFTYHVGITGQNPPSGQDLFRSYIALVAESNLNDSGPGDYYFKATRYSMNAGYVFNNRLPLDVKASFQNSAYERHMELTSAGTLALRDDDRYNLEGSLGYIVSDYFYYIVVKIVAGYEDRSSNIAGRGYTNNYLMAKMDFKYSLGKR